MLHSAQIHYVLRGDAAGSGGQVTDGPSGLQKRRANAPIHHPAAAGLTGFPAIPALYLGRMNTLGFAEGPRRRLEVYPVQVPVHGKRLVTLQQRSKTKQGLQPSNQWKRRVDHRDQQ